MKGHFCCFIIQTRAQGGSISVLHFGTPPLITSMLHAGAQRSTSGDSLTVSRSVTSVRNIVPVTSSFGDAYFSTYMEVRWTRRPYVCCTTLSCVCHTCYTVSQLNTVSAVELQNGQIVSKSGGENEERWRPWTPRCVYTFSSHDMFIFMCQLCQNVLT